ncbi:flavodoxin family protein [bacterium]|nr:flavodoxin family protein [bacterium]
MKKVLILSGSPRRGGNSDTLCDEFLRGAKESGNDVEKIFVAEKNIGYCKACNACKDTGVCAIKDDMAEVLQKMLDADVIVLSSPVYFYSISAQLKAVIDRTVARWLEFRDKEFYYIMTAAEDEATTMDCTLECFRGLAACLEGSKEMGVICAKGVYNRGEIDDTKFIQLAYKMGKSVGKKRLLTEIVDKLSDNLQEKQVDKKMESISSKTFWNKIDTYVEDVDVFASDIIDTIETLVNKSNYLRDYSDTTNTKLRTQVTFVEKGKEYFLPWRTEEALERAIVVANDKQCLNQIVLPDGGHVDLITDMENGNATFVELKMWTNESDSPLYAILESLKNYYLFNSLNSKKYPKINEYFNKRQIENIKKLVVLAPQEYYDLYKTSNESSYEFLKKLISAIKKNMNSEIEIELKTLDLSCDEWENFIKKLDIHEKTEVCLMSKSDEIGMIKDKLKF